MINIFKIAPLDQRFNKSIELNDVLLLARYFGMVCFNGIFGRLIPFQFYDSFRVCQLTLVRSIDAYGTFLCLIKGIVKWWTHILIIVKCAIT